MVGEIIQMIEFPEIPNCELYLVGGCVRDHLLGKKSKDLDFIVITDLSFSELVLQISGMSNSKVFLAKPEFLTIRAKINGQIVDLTFPRSDGEYIDGRRPETTERVELTLHDMLLEDSKRRDFTINALYMNKHGGVTDFHNGKADLENKIIRTVGDPKKRFAEDYLRILRAVRFAVQLEFHIAQDTEKYMTQYASQLEKISTERIREELNMALKYYTFITIDWITKLDIYYILKLKNLTFQLTSKRL